MMTSCLYTTLSHPNTYKIMMAVGLEDKIKSVPDNIVSKHKTINYTLKLVHENNGLQHVVYTLYPFNFVVGGHLPL
jgi:hypothetical protein